MTTLEKLTCKNASVLVSQGQDRRLTPVEQMRLQAHLAICEVCRNFQRQMDFLRKVFRQHPAAKDEED
jgi:predicted anti-sigma-YlaC factor YlaD